MPEEPTTPQNEPTPSEDTQTVGLKKSPQPNKDESWKKVDAVFNAAKNSFLEKDSTFEDVLDSLIATLMDIRAAGKPAMGGMGMGNPEMDLPPAPQDEQIPENL